MRAPVAAACRRMAMAAGLSIAATGAPDTLAGQVSRPTSPAAPGTAEARRAAQAAQRRFERTRRSSLPVGERRGPLPCEVRIGRYCYWYDSTARPPAEREAERVTVARRRLLEVLDSLAVASPADAWITGQRVRYRIDAGDTAAAVQLATTGCRLEGWWCDALLGYAQHIAGAYPASQRAFERMLGGMSVEDRCAWENPAVLLEHAARSQVQRLACSERRRVAERLWWAATPQLGRAGNDIFTEFLARRVESLLEADAESLYDTRWSWDADELLLRYGWSTWWTRERDATMSGQAQAQLVGHSRTPAFDFLPSGRAILDGRAPLKHSDWNRGGATPAMRYAAPHVQWWGDATAQVAHLRRDDTLLVVAAYEAPADTMLADARAVLVLSAGPRAPVHASAARRGRAGVVQARMPRPPGGIEVLASVEVVDTARRAMARYRESVIRSQDERLALSDLVLHRPLAHAPATITLVDVLEHMLPANAIGDARVGVYWETYGVRAGETLDLVLTIERLDAPWLRRAAARLRLAAPVTPVQIRWREPLQARGSVAARAMSVNVANLGSGEYRLRMRARGADGAEAASERVIRIRR